MKRLPKSKKKRIQNKYIPKGPYCHGRDLNYICPYWSHHKATKKELKEIFEREKEYQPDLKGMSFEDFLKHLDTLPEKENTYFTDVFECKRIHYKEYCQDSLLWDQCKECGRNDNYLENGPRKYKALHTPNNIRRKSKKEQWEWKKKNYPYFIWFISSE